MKVYVSGCSKHKGDYEGNAYDYSKIYTTVPMQQGENKKGSAGVDLRCEPHVFDILKAANFKVPIACDVETELRALGGGNAKETVVNVTILKSA